MVNSSQSPFLNGQGKISICIGINFTSFLIDTVGYDPKDVDRAVRWRRFWVLRPITRIINHLGSFKILFGFQSVNKSVRHFQQIDSTDNDEKLSAALIVESSLIGSWSVASD